MTISQINRLLLGFFIVALSLPAFAGGEAARPNTSEQNVWPFAVTQMAEDGSPVWQQCMGPFFFSRTLPDGGQAEGFRPFYLERNWKQGQRREIDILYPLFFYRSESERWNWSVLNLINHRDDLASDTTSASRGFDIWPVYFSKKTGDPATSYKAVFPLFGPLKNRLGYDRVDWVLFPLYARFQQGERVSYAAPWPFIRIIKGGDNRGWALWPLAGWREQKGKTRSQFYLWPLIYKNESRLDQPSPSLSYGVLPFYSADHSADSDSETYLWPFFGYTHRKAPSAYRETRWFWPFFVQGRGEERMRNRWAPFYTHSVVKGLDKTWVLWPLYRRQSWVESGLQQTKTQVLFFLYWSLEQQRPGQTGEGPRAEKTHLWPLVSVWDNGAGQRQAQVLNPLEVFFSHNDTVRLNWTPFFSLYQFEQRRPGHERHTLLWNALSFESSDSGAKRSFHVGPLVGFEKNPEAGKFSLLGGLFGLQRRPGQSVWKPFVCHFSKGDPSPAKQP
jgi:hypothetical protein